ncbi:MAG: 50S ribosomal protein L1 [Candidatus Altiarchaeota archaeon]|nr:50S ribosomal protein L1 [Candidatus Altiarchaeota archaeon]
MDFKKTIKEAKAEDNKRNFKQTVELIVNLKGIDPKKFSINDAYKLPAGMDKKRFVCVVGSGEVALKAKKSADLVIDKKDIGSYADKKKGKELASKVDFFVVEMPLMAEFAKAMGTILGPRGKMPLPKHIVSFDTDPTKLIGELKNTARVVVKKSAIAHLVIGTEDMSDEELTKNAEFLYDILLHKLERGDQNINNMYIKLTMGKPVKVK